MHFGFNNKVTRRSNYIPVALRKYAISYADTLIAEDQDGTIFLQEIRREGFVITLAVFAIRKEIFLKTLLDGPSLVLVYWLTGNDVTGNLAGVGKVKLFKGRYNLFYIPAGTQTGNMEKGLYSALYVELSPIYLKKLSKEYAMVNTLIERLENASDIGEFLPFAHIAHEFEIVKNDMLYSNKTGTALDLELEAGVLRLLSLYEQELARGERAPVAFKTNNIVVNTVIDYIHSNLTIPKLSIRNIEKELNVSIRKLERDFKRHTGMTMTEYHQQEKMKRAAVLIRKSAKPIKEVAWELGYLDVSAFIRIFKKIYGVSPSSIRDNPNILPAI